MNKPFKMAYRFSPGVVPTVLVLLFLPVFIGLGLWQLDRAADKKAMNTEFLQRQNGAAILLNDTETDIERSELNWQTVKVTGHFDNRFTILLDNQIWASKAGYLVFTPFVYGKSERKILVNRGWIPLQGDRSKLPVLNSIDGRVEISGVIKKIPFSGIGHQQAKTERLSNTVFRVQRISTEKLGALTHYTLPDRVIRLDKESAHGFKREWKMPGSGEAKHYGYAFQWFAFSIVMIFLYIYLNLHNVQKND